jgi:hypothetical protein
MSIPGSHSCENAANEGRKPPLSAVAPAYGEKNAMAARHTRVEGVLTGLGTKDDYEIVLQRPLSVASRGCGFRRRPAAVDQGEPSQLPPGVGQG